MLTGDTMPDGCCLNDQGQPLDITCECFEATMAKLGGKLTRGEYSHLISQIEKEEIGMSNHVSLNAFAHYLTENNPQKAKQEIP